MTFGLFIVVLFGLIATAATRGNTEGRRQSGEDIGASEAPPAEEALA